MKQMKRLSLLGNVMLMLMCCVTMSMFNSCAVDDTPVTPPETTPGYPYEDDIDASVKPGDDFYQYALGSWLAAHPREQGLAGSMVEQEELEKEWLRSIAKTDCSDPAIAHVVEQWNIHKNDIEMNKVVLKAKMEEIDHISNSDEFVAMMVKLFLDGYSPFMQLNKRVTRKSYYMEMGPSIAYLTTSDVKDLQKKGFQTVDYEVAKDACHKVNEAIHSASQTAEGNTIVQKLLTQLAVPEGYLHIDDNTNDDLQRLGTVIANPIHLEDLKACLKICIAYRDIDILEFSDDSDFADVFSAKGSLKCLNYNLDQLYFKQKVNQSDVDNALQMCEEFRSTFDQRLVDNPWMGDVTKAAAREKLAAMKFFCGSDKYLVEQYLLHKPSGKTFYENAIQLIAEQRRLELRILPGPGDDYKAYYDVVLYQPGYVANACYSQEFNSCYIPSSNLYYPASDRSMADYYNYAVLGARIGHEITHGFDENGSQLDKYGEKENWWVEADKTEFERRLGLLTKHFATIEVLPGIPCDPWSSMTENTADYGGLCISIQLFKKKLADRGLSQQQIKEQMRNFFLSFAKGLGRNFSPEEIDEINGAGSHAVPNARVNGNVSLMPEWYEAFDVKPGEKLYHAPEARVVVW